MLVVARTGQDERGGRLSLFIVPADAPGLDKHLLPVDLLLPERQFTLHFDEVRVGPGALVGEEGEGFRQVFHGLNPERITGAALAVGVARYALGAAARYATERKVWSEPIGAHQGVSHPLAKAKIETELAALMTRQAAWQHDHGVPAGESANMAKYAAAEAALAALDAAIQTHGGNGLASEYGLAALLGPGPAAAHRAGQPGDDPQLRGPAQPGPAPLVLRRAVQESPVDLARNLIGRINVGDSLTRTAASTPDQLAVVDGDRRFTYAEFNAYVNRLAHGLAGRGYDRGDALALASGNSADFLAVYYACAKLGVVCVPINLGWRPDEVAYVLGHSRARGIVVETQLVAACRTPSPRCPRSATSSSPRTTSGTSCPRRTEPLITARSRRRSSTTGTRSATSTPRARRPSPRAWSARTWPSTWSRCRARWTPAGAAATSSPR